MALKEHYQAVELDDNEVDHLLSGTEDTPIKVNAFSLTDKEKIAIIEKHFSKILDTLGMDMTDDSLSETPHRVAKMYVEEIFKGLNPKNKPEIKLFKNKYKYNEMLLEKNIRFTSTCEHHLLPIVGKAHVAYIPNKSVVGLSKLNRVVHYYANRPQVQERLTRQIGKELIRSLGTENIAVVIEATHLCVSSRGVGDKDGTTITSFYSGNFKEAKHKKEFLQHIKTGSLS